MAIAQKQNTKQSTILLIVFALVVVGGTLAYFYFRPAKTGTTSGSRALSKDPEIFTEFGQALYDTDQFKDLADYSKDIPVTDLQPAPIPVPDPGINDQVDLPANAKIGNDEPFRQ